MAKYIAHASIDERGKVSGGKAGDQTKKEICIRTMYYKPWNQFFHIVNDAVRNQFGNNMIDIANNDNIGYDQNQRNTILTQAKKVDFDFTKIKTKCEGDCSSVITTALLGAIYKILGIEAYKKALEILVVEGNCSTTSTFKTRVTKLKDVTLIDCHTSISYTASTGKAVFGDIYNKAGSHIVCYVDDGKKKTDKKYSVKEFQKAAIADGFSFPKHGPDGEWGAECEAVAKKAIVKCRRTGGKPVYKYPNLTKIVQDVVGSEKDGKCGVETQNHIISWQNENGLQADGCIGLQSWKKILGIK